MLANRVLEWTKSANGLLVGIGALLGTLFGIKQYVYPYAMALVGAPVALAVSILAALLVASISLILTYPIFAAKSLLLRPDRFDLKIRDSGDLLGRDQDIEDLLELVLRRDVVFVDGESGSGKSSLARHGLLPRLAPLGEFLAVYVDRYGEQWDLGPCQQVCNSIWESLAAEQREILGVRNRPSIFAINPKLLADLLHGVASKLGRRTILIFDQFDDYQLAFREKFLDVRNAWISSKDLSSTSEFWKVVSTVLDTGEAKLLVIARSDASAGLVSVRFKEESVRTIQRLNCNILPQLLARTDADDGKGLVVRDSQQGWDQLKDLLAVDLLSDNDVLPQQVRSVLLGLRTLSWLTPMEYRKMGRAKGMEALFIRDGVRRASRESGVPEKDVRTLLLLMVVPDERGIPKTKACTAQEIKQAIPNELARRRTLDRLICDGIVRELLDNFGKENAWRLDHDYLVTAVLEEQRLTNRELALLRETAKGWERTRGDSVLTRYRALLPLSLQLRFLVKRFSPKSQFRYGPYWRFALASLSRTLPTLVVGSVALGWLLWTNSIGYQIDRIIVFAHTRPSELARAAEWPESLALAGHLEKGLSEVDSLDPIDRRIEALTHLAVIAGIRGDPARAVELMESAISISRAAKRTSLGEDTWSFVTESNAIGRLGYTKEAIFLLKSFEGSKELGYFDSDASSKANAGMEQVEALIRLQATADAVNLGKTLVPLVTGEKSSPSLVARLAVDFAASGDKVDSRQLLQSIKPLDATLHAEDSEDSILSEKRRSITEKTLALLRMTCAYHLLGDESLSQKSREVAAKIMGSWTTRYDFELWEDVRPPQLFSYLTKYRLLKFPLPLERADTIEAEAFVQSAKEAFAEGNIPYAKDILATAESWVKKKRYPVPRSKALEEIAIAWYAMGDSGYSRKLLLAAAKDAEMETEPTLRGPELVSIAKNLIKIGAAGDARPIVEEADIFGRTSFSQEDRDKEAREHVFELAYSHSLPEARAYIEAKQLGGNERVLQAALDGYGIKKYPVVYRRYSELDEDGVEAICDGSKH